MSSEAVKILFSLSSKKKTQQTQRPYHPDNYTKESKEHANVIEGLPLQSGVKIFVFMCLTDIVIMINERNPRMRSVKYSF